jgi:Photoprotection regulator fluorescence recovery protein
MHEFKWSPKEKQIARAVFEKAALHEERELLTYFREKAAGLASLEQLWALQFEIRDAERDYQRRYDFRYSQLPIVFGRLLKDGRIEAEDIHGLGDEKIEVIKRIAEM